jgi:hypothetical protein
MNRVRRPPLQHPLALLFDRAIDSFTVSLSPDTIRHYRGTARNFLSYLGADYPEVQSLDQLRREPHILGWMSRLHSQVPQLVTRLNQHQACPAHHVGLRLPFVHSVASSCAPLCVGTMDSVMHRHSRS